MAILTSANYPNKGNMNKSHAATLTNRCGVDAK